MSQGPYDPAPTATICVRQPGAPLVKMVPVTGLLDTGSPWTYVSRDIAEEQCLPDAGEESVRFADGTTRRFKARWADIRIFGTDVPNVRVLVPDGDDTQVLVGRDVLRRFAVTFDGPNKLWQVV